MNDETTRGSERASSAASSPGDAANEAARTAGAAGAGEAGAASGAASSGASGGAANAGAASGASGGAAHSGTEGAGAAGAGASNSGAAGAAHSRTEGAGAEAAAAGGAAKGRSPWLFVLRDLSLALAVLSLFAAADAWYVVTEFAAAAVLSVLVALLAGTALAFLIHEWGHYIGGLLSGSHMRLGKLSAPTLFSFDFDKNTQGQFQWMSAGGNIAPWLFAGLFVAAIGAGSPARLALFSAVIGAIVFFHTTELPVIWRTANGMAPKQSLGKLTIPTLARNGVIGAFVAVAMLGVLSPTLY